MAQVPRKVFVIIGVGGMGITIARRLGGGRHVVLVDNSEANLQSAAETLRQEGHDVKAHAVNIVDYTAVEKVAQEAGNFGNIEAIVNTAGVSPVMATPKQIYDIDLLGTINIIDAFLAVATPGTSLVCISSNAAYTVTLSKELEKHLATAPREKILGHPELEESAHAYPIAKMGNILRVQGEARAWGSKGARINSISPGIISTPMAAQELKGRSGNYMRELIENRTAARRLGTPDDIANAVAFLTNPSSSFVTGTDIVVDGGGTAGYYWHGGRDIVI